VDLEARDASFSKRVSWKYCIKQCILSFFWRLMRVDYNSSAHSGVCVMSLMPRVGRLCEELDVWVVVVELCVSCYWYTELDIFLLLLYIYIKNQIMCCLLD